MLVVRQLMRVFPNTKDEWFALVVFPFKAYVAVVVPFYYIFRMFCPQPFLGTNVSDGTRDILLQYFLLCAPVLLLSAAIQAFVSGRRAASHTLAFAAVPTLVLLLVLLSAYRSIAGLSSIGTAPGLTIGLHWTRRSRSVCIPRLLAPRQ